MKIDLQLYADVATPEEIRRGEAAAWAVFEAAEVNPWAAAEAEIKQSGKKEEITDEEAVLAKLWRKAVFQATEACCGTWKTEPHHINLVLVR